MEEEKHSADPVFYAIRFYFGFISFSFCIDKMKESKEKGLFSKQRVYFFPIHHLEIHL